MEGAEAGGEEAAQAGATTDRRVLVEVTSTFVGERRGVNFLWATWHKVDARMGEIEEKMHAEIESEEQAFKEKEEKEK